MACYCARKACLVANVFGFAESPDMLAKLGAILQGKLAEKLSYLPSTARNDEKK